MRFYSTMCRSYGWAKKGKRAVTRVPPGSNLSLRTQVAMAVHPTLGLLKGVVFPPKKVQNASRKCTWGKEAFIQFVDKVLDQLAGTCAKDVENKIVTIILDSATEHGSDKALQAAIVSLPSAKALDSVLGEGKIMLCRAPSNSPQINLCEYYNRSVRGKANHLRHLPEYAALLEFAPRGQVIDKRLDVVMDIITKSLWEVQTGHPLSTAVTRLYDFLDDIVKQGGHDGESHFASRLKG